METGVIENMTGVQVDGSSGYQSPLERFQDLRAAMKAALIERDNEINMLLLTVISGEHAVFVGPPGTAKSHMLNSLVAGIRDAKRFNVLMSRFTTPEEVFGPLNIAKLKEGHYTRIPQGMLPDCHLAFFDEVFKASSAILNTCLTAMEERVFKNDGKNQAMPLLSLVGASNEWPVGEGYNELSALFDRFLFRAAVKPISPASRERLLFEELPPVHSCISLNDVHDAQTQASSLRIERDVKDAYEAILQELKAQGITPGDRRVRKAVNAVRAQAWLNGHSEVMVSDLECLKDILWDDPREQISKTCEVVLKIANPSGAEITRLLTEVEEILNLPSTVKAEPNAEFFSSIKKLKDIKGRLDKMRHGVVDPTKIDEALNYIQTRLSPITTKATSL